MSGKYPKYSPEFREEAAKMVVEGSRAIAQVAREYGLSETTLGNWVRAYREAHAADEPPLELSERGAAAGIGAAESGTGNGKHVPEKSASVPRKGASVSDKYAFIDAEYAYVAACAPSIGRMCRWLQVSRSGYYEWLHRPASATAQRRELLKIKIEALFEACDGTYGYRRLHQKLVRGGEQVGLELVRALMRELGLVACQPRPFRATTVQGGEQTAVPDLVGRDFSADAPGCKLVGDITYIPTWAGWLYLATVIDCFNKEVIGHAMADHMRTSLVGDALGMAARNHRLAWTAFSIRTAARNTPQPNSLRNSPRCICGNLWAAPGVAMTMRWPNPFSRPSKMSGCTAPFIRPGTKPNTILPTTLKSSIIGNDSTQRWATGPRTRSASNI